ncbi:type I restriction-modification system subunit M [Catenisphaera adipataccumulans]|uniref:site-specific DNA-methyltransferase (adenine-specific) n=1 Tax=Catenisphaera adipataccumulans TaxID=700500 RepID=A0A7W8CVS4_9FIRM|nr:type I restriction-modification system subunit M [Catenisphaera adipataccumulans]MBB5182490.1 type I restriction enzyme M protein [Catenisphaera adipataccumulans]
MNKQQLAAKIWESANKMRSKIEANEYKDYILGFIFYKYLSDREEEWLLSREYTPEDIKEYVNEEDEETVKNTQQSLGYFIAYEDLFSTWIKMGSDFSIDNVRLALSSFIRLISPTHQNVFKDIFNTLDTGLSKLGDNTKSQTKAVSDLIHLIKDIPMDSKQGYDVLGYIYEYLLEKFASNAGKKAGEFYTPHEVSLLMSEIVAHHLQGNDEIKIYDPTSGSGSLLINIGHAVAKYIDDPNKIRYYAQELKANTYNLTRMNLVMRGILPDNIVVRNGDTLEEDWPYFEESDPIGTYDPLYVDAVVSNPPYSQNWDPSGKENDPRFARYGLAPKAKADYAFLLHDLYHLKPNGIMTIVLPHGVLFRGGEEGKIRKNLIEQNNIDTIIGLPANIFYGTGIPTIIMVLRQKRENTDVLIVDASKGFTKEGKNNKLRACDIRKIVDTVTKRQEIDKYSRRVTLEEIRSNDYNLNIPRYVDSSEEAESWDIYASMFGGIPKNEIDQLNQYWEAFPTLRKDIFGEDKTYSKVQVDDLKQVIDQNEDVKNFLAAYKKQFSNFGNVLTDVLISKAENLNVAKTEDLLSSELFERFDDIPLVDPYDAYEIFHNAYSVISTDLEMIQTEGMKAVKQVDPNMVIKKKNNKEQEIQDGWKGHILPFDLVQKTFLSDELEKIKQKESRLNEIPSEYENILSEMSEDDKETISDALKEDNDAFVMKNIKPTIKMLTKTDSVEYSELIDQLQKVEVCNKEEKSLKSQLKKDKEEIELRTKEVILNLDVNEIHIILQKKWIEPILDGIMELPESALKELQNKVNSLNNKYSDTLADIEKEIQETEAKLSEMMSDLTGSEEDIEGIREFQKLLGGDF